MKTAKSKTSKPKKTAKPAAVAVVAPVRKAAVKLPAAKVSTAKTQAPAADPRREITSDCIASRAYSLWEQQGRPQGRDLEFWLQAKTQLESSQSFAA